ncbi:hypothetical protein [Candidatus Bodocaedibacter vickermanii]|uniref:RHS repeat-associated core domain-containing protein n=1 Tax=Candidatus Bodocaedibacter vickermanii TaxID=2741701 RepID=A0A7L9RUT1_9PROT|nr:RHS repeat-associated core domain-containing protein [Candidatus Paracaedibacteraceae bacterium 'Lake Konstanz']
MQPILDREAAERAARQQAEVDRRKAEANQLVEERIAKEKAEEKRKELLRSKQRVGTLTPDERDELQDMLDRDAAQRAAQPAAAAAAAASAPQHVDPVDTVDKARYSDEHKGTARVFLTEQQWSGLLYELENGEVKFHVEKDGFIRVESKTAGEFYTTVQDLEIMQVGRAQGLQHIDFEVLALGDLGRQAVMKVTQKALERIAANKAKRIGSRLGTKAQPAGTTPLGVATAGEARAAAAPVVEAAPAIESTVSVGDATLRAPYNPHRANSANAQAALNQKMSALEKAANLAERTETLPDGRIRYYAQERLSSTPGATRGASFVTEFNPKTGQVRSWNECYDHSGNVNRVHPKGIDGQTLKAPHYPMTKSELEKFLKLGEK